MAHVEIVPAYALSIEARSQINKLYAHSRATTETQTNLTTQDFACLLFSGRQLIGYIGLGLCTESTDRMLVMNRWLLHGAHNREWCTRLMLQAIERLAHAQKVAHIVHWLGGKEWLRSYGFSKHRTAESCTKSLAHNVAAHTVYSKCVHNRSHNALSQALAMG